jgi:hypothetical protein
MIPETSFRSFVAFPAFSMQKKGKGNLWMAEGFGFPLEFSKFEGEKN